jgi:hypothetical protein
MRSAREQPSEPPQGEREHLVAANGIAVGLATFAMTFYILYKQIVIFHIPVMPANATSSAIH